MHQQPDRVTQKRARSPDGEVPENHYRGGPAQRHGYGHGYGHGGFRNKKRFKDDHSAPVDDDVHVKIAKLGDFGLDDDKIAGLALNIRSELEKYTTDETKINDISTTICRCIISFPTRTGSYALLLGLINSRCYPFSCRVVNMLHASYTVYLEAQKWKEALTIIYFLSSLVCCKVIKAQALISQFELLLEKATEEGIPQARGDYFAYTVLSSLPYVALTLTSGSVEDKKAEKKSDQNVDQNADQNADQKADQKADQVQSEPESKNDEATAEDDAKPPPPPPKSEPPKPDFVEEILKIIETYLAKRSKSHLSSIRSWSSDDSTMQMDYLDSLWIQIKNLRSNSWRETFIHRPYFINLVKEDIQHNIVQQTCPSLQIPAHSIDYVYPAPRVVLRVFEDNMEVHKLTFPGSYKIERFCIENSIRDIIDELPNDVRSCSYYLSQMFRHAERRHFAAKHLLIEVLIAELFTLPRPKHHELLYHNLLFRLQKYGFESNNQDIKNNFDTILFIAVKVLYDNLETMNIICLNRFAKWFSSHLNAFELIFPWQIWADACTRDSSSPRRIFVEEFLGQLIRLNFPQKVSNLVKEHLEPLIPPEPVAKFKPIYQDMSGAEDLAQNIKAAIGQKKDPDELCKILNILVPGIKTPEDFIPFEEKPLQQLLKVDIFAAVIFNMASRSITHLQSAINKFINFFRVLVNVNGGSLQLLRTVHSCLQDYPQAQLIFVLYLYRAGLVTYNDVCEWVFSEEVQKDLFKSYPWEIIEKIGSRMLLSAQDLESKIKDATASKIDETVDEEVGQTPPNNTDDNDNGDVVMKSEPNVDSKKDDVENLTVKLAEVRQDYEEFSKLIFRLFHKSLESHIRHCESSNKSFMDPKFRWLTGRLQEAFFNSYNLSQHKQDELRSIVDQIPSVGCLIMNLNK